VTLTGESCSSTTFCMLVGYYQVSQTHIIEPLTVLWDGLS
jgi:hypothetical protein